MEEGFVDLRYRGETGTGSDSFWPSFTDIMMVVVMIFMLASTILMLRNWDLVRELRATIEAERQAEALARSATETSATLEERLAQAQHEISELRMQLMRAAEKDRATREQLAAAEQKLLETDSERRRLAAGLQQAQRDIRLGEDRYRQLEDAHATRGLRLEETLAEVRQLEEERGRQQEQLTALQQRYAGAEQQIVSMQGDYDDLKVKYDKLVKPARSAVGKHVVTVRYWKEGEYYQIRLKEAEEGQYRPVTLKQLNQRLAVLKDEHASRLYVKVIIPDDSGLSYNEAWGFTMDILEKYDYYHQ